ncbi:hypothetical protein J6590_081218 [Homalodisca vitripennis]|nr:hypothetical protein J6590_081218 [Homalodisca vitripennis]
MHSESDALWILASAASVTECVVGESLLGSAHRLQQPMFTVDTTTIICCVDHRPMFSQLQPYVVLPLSKITKGFLKLSEQPDWGNVQGQGRQLKVNYSTTQLMFRASRDNFCTATQLAVYRSKHRTDARMAIFMPVCQSNIYDPMKVLRPLVHLSPLQESPTPQHTNNQPPNNTMSIYPASYELFVQPTSSNFRSKRELCSILDYELGAHSLAALAVCSSFFCCSITAFDEW